jgi:N-glycosylase/DNA lyase
MQKHSINLNYTINSGQVFLWEKEGSMWYGINGLDVISVQEDPFEINSLSQCNCDFFRESDELDMILKNISKDKVVKKAVLLFPGLRLLRQDPFQCFISFIVSANSSIQNIQSVLKKICKKFGVKVKFEGKEFFLFPEPKKLSHASSAELLDCGLGYRVKAVKEASYIVSEKQIDFDYLKKTNYENAKEILLEVYGIGNKVADCIMLFSLEKLEAFPLDRWMIRILEKYYPKKFHLNEKTLTEKKYDDFHQMIVNHFGLYAGYSQQFLYKMERELYQKKWL